MSATPNPVVYKLLWEKTGQYYIGATKWPVDRRGQHFYRMRKGRHVNKRIQEAFNQSGLPVFEVLLTCEESVLDDKEEEILNLHIGNEKCLNLTRRTPRHVRELAKAGEHRAYDTAQKKHSGRFAKLPPGEKAARASQPRKPKTDAQRAARRAHEAKRLAEDPEYRERRNEYFRKRYATRKALKAA